MQISRRLPILVLLILLCVAPAAVHAQLQVSLEFSRRLFVLHEPIEATVQIRNLTGREITLRDDGNKNWFAFDVTRPDGGFVEPTGSYQLGQLVIQSGDTVRRKINITPLYQIREFGIHRVRAQIYFADMDKLFVSQRKLIEITEGKTLWRQTVGVPEGMGAAGETRTYSLLSHSVGRGKRLYVRVADPQSGITYGTYSIGRLLTFGDPFVEIDSQSRLHVLHLVAPKQYQYTVVDLDGRVAERSQYITTRTEPRLRRRSSGSIAVAGGELYAPAAQAVADSSALSDGPPKLSDRPPLQAPN
jgi:hypothetical protein